MAIELKFSTIIVPIGKIETYCGIGTFATRYEGLLPPVFRHDEYLFAESVMNASDISDSLDQWETQGFTLTAVINGHKIWQDLCVANSHHGPSYPCNWLDYNSDTNTVWFKK